MSRGAAVILLAFKPPCTAHICRAVPGNASMYEWGINHQHLAISSWSPESMRYNKCLVQISWHCEGLNYQLYPWITIFILTPFLEEKIGSGISKDLFSLSFSGLFGMRSGSGRNKGMGKPNSALLGMLLFTNNYSLCDKNLYFHGHWIPEPCFATVWHRKCTDIRNNFRRRFLIALLLTKSF